MRSIVTAVRAGRALALSLALAATLATVPLLRLSAAAHDPLRSGAGVGTRLPVVLESAARVLAPGSAFSATGASLVTHRIGGVVVDPVRQIEALVGAPAGPAATLLLAIYGRLQLDGG